MRVKNYLSLLFSRKTKNTSSLSKKDKDFQKKIISIIHHPVHNLEHYRQAFSLKNTKRKLSKEHERLEFLGDAILGSIISSYLYKTYQEGNEGYLTQMKSKIVSRENLNQLGDNLALKEIIQTEKVGSLSTHISGNLFEALIGAIYLDVGYQDCEKIVLKHLFTPEQINKLENKIASYKGLILEWAQKNKHQLQFTTEEEDHPTENNFFRSKITFNKEVIANACDSSKKKAEEKTAQRAFYTLNKKHKILEKI